VADVSDAAENGDNSNVRRYNLKLSTLEDLGLLAFRDFSCCLQMLTWRLILFRSLTSFSVVMVNRKIYYFGQ